MRILFILHQFYPEFRGGTENVALKLAKAAQRAGHYAHVLACTLVPPQETPPSATLPQALETVHEGVPVTLLPRSLMSAPIEYSFETDHILVDTLTTWLQHQHFDIAHILHSMRMASALLAVQRCRVPYVVSLTDFFFVCFRVNMMDTEEQLCLGSHAGTSCAEKCLCVPWSSEGLRNRYLQAQGVLNAAGARVCPSQYVADRCREAFPGLDFTIIPHGIDLVAMTAHANAPAIRSKGGLTLGFIGAIVPQKGLTTLLRAFAAVPSPHMHLLIIGGFYGDTVYHDEVRRLIKNDSRITLVGEVTPDQIYQHLQTIDLLCLRSLVPESFSLVLAEAAAAGVPALVSDLGAPGERVLQSDCGMILPAGDVDAWSTAITEITIQPDRLAAWRAALPLPLRIEEEAFFYESLYRRLLLPA